MASRGSGHILADFLRDRRLLLRNLLFVALVAMPVGGLVGAALGFAFGFVFALFGFGIGAIFTFPMTGLCFGQAFAVGGGVVLAAILGESVVAPLRRKVLALGRFVFAEAQAAPAASDPVPPRSTPL